MPRTKNANQIKTKEDLERLGWLAPDAPIPDKFLPTALVCFFLPAYGGSSEGIRKAIANNAFKSGVDILKQGGRWAVNPAKHIQRLTQEQQKTKVC